MYRAFVAIFAWLLLLQLAHSQVPGLPIVDFQRYFPHLVAVSEEVTDPKSSTKLQWKFIAVRDEQESVVWVALTRREGSKRLVRSFLAKGPVEASESAFRGAVAKFSETEHIKFEIIDLRDVRTFDQFNERARGIGWGLEPLPK